MNLQKKSEYPDPIGVVVIITVPLCVPLMSSIKHASLNKGPCNDMDSDRHAYGQRQPQIGQLGNPNSEYQQYETSHLITKHSPVHLKPARNAAHSPDLRMVAFMKYGPLLVMLNTQHPTISMPWCNYYMIFVAGLHEIGTICCSDVLKAARSQGLTKPTHK